MESVGGIYSAQRVFWLKALTCLVEGEVYQPEHFARTWSGGANEGLDLFRPMQHVVGRSMCRVSGRCKWT